MGRRNGAGPSDDAYDWDQPRFVIESSHPDGETIVSSDEAYEDVAPRLGLKTVSEE